MTHRRESRPPTRWIEESSPREIAEAILAVDAEKAAGVAAAVTAALSERVGEAVGEARRRLEENPLAAAAGILFRGITTGRRRE